MRTGKRAVCIASSDISDEEIVYVPGKNGKLYLLGCI
jgi:hypothetical protein